MTSLCQQRVCAVSGDVWQSKKLMDLHEHNQNFCSSLSGEVRHEGMVRKAKMPLFVLL